MAEYVVAVVVDGQERNYHERIRLRQLRDESDPFHIAIPKFRKIFRIPNSSAQFLCEQLVNHIALNESGNLPIHLKILGALQFFADGSYQTADGMDSLISLSQPSMSRAIEETTNAILDLLTPQYIKFPITQQEKASTMQEFQEKYNMPNTLGAVDGTHIAIFKPPNTDLVAPGVLFYNRKGFYSINCQVITNANGRITSINPDFPGSTHDAAVWRASAVSRHLEGLFLNGEQNQWLLGDKGYPLLPWLMTPVGEPGTEAEEVYNSTHASARNVVEMSFGRLKNKFRCLHKHRTLHYKPEKAARIVIAICTLYNMFCDVLSDDSDDESLGDDDDPIPEDDEAEPNPYGDYLAMARAKREALIQHFA